MDTDLLHQFLKDHDAPCPECRYNLRNLTTDRCPECGTPVTLTVGQASEFSWLWLGFLIPFFLLNGTALIFIVAHFVYGTPPGPQRFLVAYTYLWLIPTFLLLRTRLWFAARSRRTRLVLLAASIAHLLAYYLCFIFELRR
jgi:hypothetical protein